MRSYFHPLFCGWIVSALLTLTGLFRLAASEAAKSPDAQSKKLRPVSSARSQVPPHGKNGSTNSLSKPTRTPRPEAIRIEIEPSDLLRFQALGESRGILVTAVSSSGERWDVTSEVKWQIPKPGIVQAAKAESTRFESVRPGKGEIHGRFRNLNTKFKVEVLSAPKAGEAQLSFVRDVLPVLSKAGCNAGACHAKPDGQNGFKLSVFSYDPKSDYFEIVKEAKGRRVFPSDPEQSLILAKPSLTQSHEGGLKLPKEGREYELVRQWIQQGMLYEEKNEPSLNEVLVYPANQSYRKLSNQQLLVIARYTDGSTRDVTALTHFESNDKELASVSSGGVVTAGQITGEAVIVARFMGLVAASRVTIPAEKSIPEHFYSQLPVHNFVDPLAYAQFRKLGIRPSELCSDEEFIRRSSLDAIGVLPTPEQVKSFRADNAKDKRLRWVELLLESPYYADYWANKWADLLRPNPDRVGIKSVYTLDQWLRNSFAQNKSFDQFAKEIIMADGSNHREGPAVVYRDRREPAELTTMFSQVFLGLRMECAKCHHHPNEKWGQEDFYQLAAYFGPVRQKGAGLSPPISAGVETFFFSPGGNVKHPVSGEIMVPKPPDGPALKANSEGVKNVDPRSALVDWMTGPKNPFFAKAIVNRVWANFFGRGFVEPVDDFRVSNPVSNEPLLDALANDFVKSGYDLKRLMKVILESRTYQLSGAPNETNLTDTKNFSRSYRRRLSAEVLLDAVSDVTGTTEAFSGMPPGARAMQAWTYKIGSQFMDAFSRPNASSDCPCDRDRSTSVVQALHMMNSRTLQSKLAEPTGRVKKLVESKFSDAEIVTELYLTTLSRPPSSSELTAALKEFGRPDSTRQHATEDVLWALLNTAEFVFNH